MPKTRKVVPLSDSGAHRDGIYTATQVQKLIGLGSDVVREAVRAGRLRVAMVGRMQIFLGEWLAEWVKSCEVRRSPIDATPSTN